LDSSRLGVYLLPSSQIVRTGNTAEIFGNATSRQF
jgi:hypothetical protein